jgi:hypothetical protein
LWTVWTNLKPPAHNVHNLRARQQKAKRPECSRPLIVDKSTMPTSCQLKVSSY